MRWCKPLIGIFLAVQLQTSHAVNRTVDDIIEREVASLPDILLQADTRIGFRARIENAHANTQGTSHGNTGALTLLYTTPTYRNLSLVLDFRHVTAYGTSKFNQGENLTPSRSSRPVIRDPDGTTLLRGYLQYNKFDDTVLRLGRQPIDLDDGRFIGTDLFRQTPRSFDALTIHTHTMYDAEIFYAYIDQVNTHYAGSRAIHGTHAHQTHLFNISWHPLSFADMTAFVYWMNDRTDTSLSNNTYGLRAEGIWSWSDLNYGYAAAYARQNNASSSLVDFHNQYWHMEAFIENAIIRGTLSHERLEGNRAAGHGFRTPLASFSRLNGFLELFNPIPDSGLIDNAWSLVAHWMDYRAHLAHHQFFHDSPRIHRGGEWDIWLDYDWMSHYTLGGGFGIFSPDGTALPRTRKLWLSFSVQY